MHPTDHEENGFRVSPAEQPDIFRLFADAIPTLAWMADADGYITWYNRRWHEYCGTTPAEMEGWGWQSVHHPAEVDAVVALWRSSIATGTPFEMTFPLRGADGTYRPFFTRVVPHFDATGALVRWFGINTEVAPLLAAEAALEAARVQAEARAAETSAILSQLAEGVIVTNAEGTITFVNEAAAALHGVRDLNVQPEDYSERYHLLTESGDPYPPHDLPLARAVRGEHVHDARWRIRRPDGREILAVGNARPILGSYGAQAGAVLTVRDETARYAAEQDLRRSEQAVRELNATLEQRITATVAERQILADIVESTDAAIMALGSDYTILAINFAMISEVERIYGVRPKVGDNFLGLLDDQPEERENNRALWGRALQGEAFGLEAEFGSAERIVYSVKFNILRDSAGAQIGAFTIASDISEQHRDRKRLAEADERLRQAQKIEAIGQLTGGVAHDFNNLLMVLSGGLQMIERQPAPAKRERIMAAMHQAVERGATLSRQLLAFSRRQPLAPIIVDLAQKIDAMRELLDGSLRGDVNVRTDFADDLWLVEVDPGELELVILNLAVNARDAMPRGGTIVIRGENVPDSDDPDVPGDIVRLSIVDEGAGMPPEVVARVFEPFFTTKEIGKGSGLGLAQAFGFAQASNGAVRVQSSVGEGTTMALLLPRALEQHAGPGPTSIVRPPDGSALAGRMILVVDDDHSVAEMVVDMLGQLGHTTIRASSAASALGMLANERNIDLVLSDIMMPGDMNGVDLAHEVRRLRPEMPVVLNSGYSGSAKLDADVMGIEILHKPFAIQDLQGALERAFMAAAPRVRTV